MPNNQRQRRTCYALCHILYPVSAAHTSIFRMDSNSTSYPCPHDTRHRLPVWPSPLLKFVEKPPPALQEATKPIPCAPAQDRASGRQSGRHSRPRRPRARGSGWRRSPRAALRVGISLSFLEPSCRSWSHFVGMHCQKLTSSFVNRLLKYPHDGPCVGCRAKREQLETLKVPTPEGQGWHLTVTVLCVPNSVVKGKRGAEWAEARLEPILATSPPTSNQK